MHEKGLKHVPVDSFMHGPTIQLEISQTSMSPSFQSATYFGFRHDGSRRRLTGRFLSNVREGEHLNGSGGELARGYWHSWVVARTDIER